MELKILEVWEDGTKDIGGRRMEDGTKIHHPLGHSSGINELISIE